MYCLIDLCCICLCYEQPFKHLSDTDDDNITYYFKLTSCVPEMCFNEMNEQRLVCNKCCETLYTVYKFRQTCLTSKTMLTGYTAQLRTISDVSGIAYVHLVDLKEEYQNENNIETKIELNFFSHVEKDNGIENSGIKNECSIASYKLMENVPNYNKMDNEDQISEKYGESFDSSMTNQDDIKLDIDENDIKIPISEIKKESETQDIEECSPPSFDDILTNESENTNIEIKLENHGYCVFLNERHEDALLYRDEIKTDIELFDHDIKHEINEQAKIENFENLSAENHAALETTLDSNLGYATMKENPESSISNKIHIEDISHESQAHNLKDHVKVHKGEKRYECSVCKKKFSQTCKRKIHMRIHTGEKPLECNVCKKKFRFTRNLKYHMKIHTDEKPHECSVCKKKFNLLGNLTSHMITHTAEKPHECSVCQKKFARAYYLKVHMTIHKEEKPFECNVCKKKFRQVSRLKVHMRIHTGEKPYECSVCKKKFVETSNLKNHMMIHAEKKPHECNICKKSFNRPDRLRLHMRLHT